MLARGMEPLPLLMTNADTVNGITYRPVRPQEILPYSRAISLGFGSVYQIRPGELERNSRYEHLARANCASDGDVIVGACIGVDMHVGVPGGIEPMSGITAVAVSPTHRRRGILTQLMRRQLAEEHQKGFALAGLWASESIIYGRYGYGIAVEQQEIAIERHRSQFRPESQALVQLHNVSFATPKEIRDIGPDLWLAKMRSTAGMVSRIEPVWEETYPDPKPAAEPKKEFRIIYRENDKPLGYAAYSLSGSKDPDGLSYQELRVKEVLAATPSAEASLWRFILNVDLVHLIKHGSHPVRSSLWRMFSDPRCMSQDPYDALWLRLLDIPKALSGRTYNSPGTVVIGITDDTCEWVDGNYELRVADNGSAECVRTDAPADLEMPVATAATIYIGAHDLNGLHAAARCTEFTAGAVQTVARMFATQHQHHVAAEF